MTTVTTRRSIRESFNSAVFRCDAGLITVLVTVRATKGCKVRRVSMTVSTSGPDALLMGARVDWEPGVVEGSSGPGRSRVASGAGRWERGRCVVRIGSAVVIGRVTRVAIGRHCGVVVCNVT